MAKFRFQFTPLQILVHLAAWIPLIVLIWDYQNGNLTANPYQAATQRMGFTALVLIILSLTITPLNTIFRVPEVIKLRRPLGLYGFMYAAIHLLIFTGLDYGFDWDLLIADLADKRYILVGLTAFLLLVPVAFTSYRWWMIRLGKRWKQLHKLVYIVNVLIVLHFAWVIKGDVLGLQGDILRPILAGVVVFLLLVARIPAIRKRLAGTGQYLIPRRTPARRRISRNRTREAQGENR